MNVELTLPTAPVALAPGSATRVPVELRNTGGASRTVRVSMARGRASAWASVEPPTATIEAGATTTVDLLLRVPTDQPPSSSLAPFTVHAEDDVTGEPAGFATGLLTVALPVPVTGTLTPRVGAADAFDLRLTNNSDGPAAVRIAATLDPPLGSVDAQPAAARLGPGETLTASVRSRPKRPLMGTPKPYAVVVSVQDALDPDRPALVKALGTGSRKPRVTSWMAGAAAIVLAVAATVAVALSDVRIPLPGQRAATPPPSALTPSAPAPLAPVSVSLPYALVEVFPHRGADGGKGVAEAARARLAGAGMPIRLVDSLTSDVLADEGSGFWVLLQDGFASVDAAQSYCTQWRQVAPRCAVTA
ncbi:hypothetical protein AB0M36_06100 [Actinoplanes sp. NPDC051346]|uniref:COG1470 family protein n=1 Tax=Actinoplanes sp. NPDC051346 TaxID=3155048 RepID=UPI00342962AE